MSPVQFDLRTIVAFAACAMLLVACDAGADDSEPAPDASTPGNAAAVSPAGSAPDAREPTDQQFPIPTPEGGERITDEWNGTTGHITMRYPADSYDEIVTFYDEYAADDGWRRTEMGQGDLPTVNYMHLMEGLNVSVAPPTGESLIVTLMAS